MSPTAIALIVLAVLVGLAWLFLVAVLRSHAELLRRLGAIESRLDPGGFALGDLDGGDRRPLQTPPTGSLRAADIAGETLAGDAVKVALGAGAPRTLLAFLSTGCSVCGSLWEELRAGGPPSPGVRIVVVTKGAERESLTRLGRLAPADGDVVMSSDAWSTYDVTATPHFVLVDSGTVTGRGGGTSWAQILSLLADADSDVQHDQARTTSERAARAEQALAASGIVPGHPSLYPSRDRDQTP
jgi:hypothetical protein